MFEQTDPPLGAGVRHLGGLRQDRLPGLISNQNLHGLVAQTIVFRRLRWQATENDGLPHS
jgi:hypothetical protein